MKKLTSFLSVVFIILSSFSQSQTISISFTAIENTTYVQLDSIKVINLNQDVDTVLYWSDTTLILNCTVGIKENHKGSDGFQIFQNYPNPAKEQTTITMFIPEKDKVNIIIYDVLGHQLINIERQLDRGYHDFRFNGGQKKLYLFTAQWKGLNQSIKIINAVENKLHTCSLEYYGYSDPKTEFKKVNTNQDFPYCIGDELLYIGFVSGYESGMTDKPLNNKNYIFQFANGIPCPGIPTVYYEGKIYNTVQIFNQCWFKENLNVGMQINGSLDQLDNGIIEKYCYGNSSTNCNIYGGLYQFEELMNYSVTEGGQGICPDGWHVPTDNEWRILEGSVDGTFGIDDAEWDTIGWRGSDVGCLLKETGTSHWLTPNYCANNSTGFTALPGGWRDLDYGFYNLGYSGHFTSSTRPDLGIVRRWERYFAYSVGESYRRIVNKKYGSSVRCLKNENDSTEQSCPGMPSVSHEGQIYHTVLIGSQCWLRENLNIGIQIDGSDNQTDNSIIEKYCYNEIEDNCSIYGGLYQWNEAMQHVITEGAQGICPDGWHIPTDEEWNTLINFLGGSSVAGGKMKVTGTAFWSSPNYGATNESGFSGLPGGYRNYPDYGGFYNLSEDGRFWSSSQSDVSMSWARYMSYASDDVGNYYYYKNFGFSIRCLKNLD